MSRRVIVTGGASGIGLAVTQRIADNGGVPVVLDRQAPPEALHLEWVEVDLMDHDATAAAFDEVLARGAVSGLVNNAGTVHPALLADATSADLDAVVSLNLRCPLQAAQAVVPSMKQQRYGRIVNITSRAALGKVARSVYSASKAGLHAMTRTWALELAEFGITANTVAPGPIDTPLFAAVNPSGAPRTQAILDSIPVGRMGSPDEVAFAVGAFLDPDAGFMTGQILYICGGTTVGLA